jgi:NADH dehydrogenase
MKFEKICVLGGSGFVGTALVSELAARGKQVKVLTRRREHAKGLILLPTVEVVEANIHDERVLAREFRGCDAVINLVGILHEKTKGRVDKPQARRGDFHENHVELPRKAISACAEAGIARFLHMSALGADPTSRSAYQRSKGAGEALVREAGWQAAANPGTLGGAKFTARRGLQVTIFRPSVIFGPGDSFLNLFARLLKLLPMVPLACPEARFQPVYVGDVAIAFADSLDDIDSFGKTYDLCGPEEYTLLQLMQYLQKVLNAGTRLVPLSDRLSYWNAWLLELKPGSKLMTRDNYFAMQVPNVCHGENPVPPAWQPRALEALAPAWLGGAVARGHYSEYRNQAHR